jgi:hypothetical protein
VNGQHRAGFGEAELRGERDGLDAAGLVEGVEVFVSDLAEDEGGGLLLGAACEGLSSVDAAGLDVHDRLKSHGERKGLGVPAFAGIAGGLTLLKDFHTGLLTARSSLAS